MLIFLVTQRHRRKSRRHNAPRLLQGALGTFSVSPTISRGYYLFKFGDHPLISTVPQIPEEAIALFRSPKARERNLIYLDEEAVSFRPWSRGRVWTVYGSPVSTSSQCTFKSLHPSQLVDAVFRGLCLQL